MSVLQHGQLCGSTIPSWVIFYRKKSLGFSEGDSIEDFILLLAVTFESYFLLAVKF